MKKFSMHLDDQAEARVNALQKRTRSQGTADVIRLALVVLEEQVNLLRSGGAMFVQRPGGQLRPYNPLLESDPDLEAPAHPQSSIAQTLGSSVHRLQEGTPTFHGVQKAQSPNDEETSAPAELAPAATASGRW
jgi:hypothetical protein